MGLDQHALPVDPRLDVRFPCLSAASDTGIAQLDRLRQANGFDTEILVRLHWRQQPMVWLRTSVHYPADGISHFRLWRDNVLISSMHARLFGGMLLRAPKLLWNRWRG